MEPHPSVHFLPLKEYYKYVFMSINNAHNCYEVIEIDLLSYLVFFNAISFSLVSCYEISSVICFTQPNIVLLLKILLNPLHRILMSCPLSLKKSDSQ